MQSCHDLLSSELIVNLMDLAQPSSALIGASSAVRDWLCAPRSRVRHIWLHRLIFHRLVSLDALRSAAASTKVPNDGIRHRVSRFALVLQRLRPAVHWFPCPPTPCDSYGDWIEYGNGTGRIQYGRLDPVESHQLWTLACALDPDFIDRLVKRRSPRDTDWAGFRDVNVVSRNAIPAEAGETWDPLPDLVHLAVFFLRSSNINMLAYTLGQLSARFPEVLVLSLPLSHWSWFCLDYKEMHQWHACHKLNLTVNCSLAQYLAVAAASQWSIPLLETVCSSLNLLPADFATWSHTLTLVLFAMNSSLPYLSCFQRPYPLLQWLQRHGLRSNEATITLANRARHYAHFKDLYDHWDCAHPSQQGLTVYEHGRTIIALLLRQDLAGMLTEFLDNNRFYPGHIADLLVGVARRPHLHHYMTILASASLHKETLHNAFGTAVRVATWSDSLTQDLANDLLKLMVPLGVNPTTFLLDLGKIWNTYFMAPFVFAPNPPIAVDKTRLLDQYLAWFSDPAVSSLDIIVKYRLVARLVEDLFAPGDTANQVAASFSKVQLAVIIACQLLSLLRTSIPSIITLQDPRPLLRRFIHAFHDKVGASSLRVGAFHTTLPSAFAYALRINIPGQYLGVPRRRSRPSNRIDPRVSGFAQQPPEVEWAFRCLLNEVDSLLVLRMSKWNKFTPAELWQRALATPGTLTEDNVSSRAIAGLLRRLCNDGKRDVEEVLAGFPQEVKQLPLVVAAVQAFRRD